MFANMLYLLHPQNGEQLALAPHSQLMYAFYFKGCSSKPGQRALIVGQIRRWRGKDAQSGGKLRQNRNPFPRILAATLGLSITNQLMKKFSYGSFTEEGECSLDSWRELCLNSQVDRVYPSHRALIVLKLGNASLDKSSFCCDTKIDLSVVGSFTVWPPR